MNRMVTVVCNHEYGNPDEVIRVESWELPSLEPNSVLVELKASPINPADLNLIEGRYLLRPPLPVIPGIEGVGVIAETGSEVDDLTIGQPVIAPNRIGFWCEAYITDADTLIPLPTEIPVENRPQCYLSMRLLLGGCSQIMFPLNRAIGLFRTRRIPGLVATSFSWLNTAD